MDLEREYTDAALKAIEPWIFILPTAVQRAVRLAASVRTTHGCATAEEMRRELGGSNWVIARRIPSIIRKYGEDVICVSSKKYQEAERRAIESRVTA